MTNTIKYLALQAAANNVKNVDDIYYMDVDICLHDGDDNVSAIPMHYGKNHLIGICVEHSYYDDDVDQYFTYSEYVNLLFPRLKAAA